MQQDQPRKWVASDDMLAMLAQRTPTTIDEMKKIRGVENLLSRHADAILACVNEGLSMAKADWPVHTRFARLSPEQDAIADMLMAQLKVLAQENQVAAAVIATRKDIEQLIHGIQTTPLLQGWRYKMAGQPLLDLLNGKRSLQVIDNKVTSLPA